MITRRNFLKSSAAALPVLAFHNNVWAAKHIPLGVQLYTVRGLAEKDLQGTLKQLRAIGYEEIEAYGGSYTYSGEQLRQIVLDAGLRVPSGHFTMTVCQGSSITQSSLV